MVKIAILAILLSLAGCNVGPMFANMLQWNPTYTYPTGCHVAYNRADYISLQTNVDREPDVSPQYWERF